MTLGMSAFTVASHSVMILILILSGYRIVRSLEDDIAVRAVIHYGLTPALALAAVALGVERAYYILARFLRPSGVDLWSMHPAPELLSMIVSAGLYLATAPLVRARCETFRRAFRVICRDWIMLAAVYFAIVAGLY